MGPNAWFEDATAAGDGVHVGHVADVGGDLVAERGGGFGQFSLVNVPHGDVCATRHHARGDGEAKALCGSGDDRVAALEIDLVGLGHGVRTFA